MNDRSYPLIDISRKTLTIMKFIGNSQSAVSSKQIESEFDMRYSTVMTHLSTLERENYIENIDGGFIGSLELATFWATRKNINGKRQKELDKEKEVLGE